MKSTAWKLRRSYIVNNPNSPHCIWEKISAEKKFSAKFWLLLLAGAVAVGVAIKKLERQW